MNSLFANLVMEERIFRHSIIKSRKSHIKRKPLILFINPGVFTTYLISNELFSSKYDHEYWNLDEEDLDILIFKLKGNKYFRIILDEFHASSVNSKFLEKLTVIQLRDNKIKGIDLLYDSVLKKIPIINSKNNWITFNNVVSIPINKQHEQTKRIADFIFALIAISPSLVFIAIGIILIKLSSKGPVLFRQERIGKNGKPFTIYKLRTMVHARQKHAAHTVENDSRVFPMGKFLRKTKIDELPQLFNILCGDMSLIGPRPERADIVDELNKENSLYKLRHVIRPGISGWAQVNNPTATPNQSFEKLEYDLYYIKNATFRLDLKIIYRTILIILKRDSL